MTAKSTRTMVKELTMEGIVEFLENDEMMVYRGYHKDRQTSELVKISYDDEGFVYVADTNFVNSNNLERLNIDNNGIRFAFLYFPQAKTVVVDSWYTALGDAMNDSRYPTGQICVEGMRFIHRHQLVEEIKEKQLGVLRKNENLYRTQHVRDVEESEEPYSMNISRALIREGMPSSLFNAGHILSIGWKDLFGYLAEPETYIQEKVRELESSEHFAGIVSDGLAKERAYASLLVTHGEDVDKLKRLLFIVEDELSEAKSFTVLTHDGEIHKVRNAMNWNLWIHGDQLASRIAVGVYPNIAFNEVHSISYRKKEYVLTSKEVANH